MERFREKRLVLGISSFLLITAGMISIGNGAGYAVGAGPQGGGLVNITADQQTYDGGKNKTYFKGNVKVAFNNIHLQGTTATVDMDGAGSPKVATFFNRPHAKRIEPGVKTQDTLEADVIKILLSENAVQAEGNAYTYVTTVAATPISIRADVQQFDNATKTMTARGGVQVDYQDTKAFSPAATLKVNSAGKAERVIFSGGARIQKDGGNITGDRITVMVGSGNLIAENNVKTDVDTKSKEGKPLKVQIQSDYQQYDKASDTVLASGNVKIVYEDYVATGPKATFKMKGGDVDKIFLTGRSTITDTQRKISADKIVITTNPKHFDAFGNVKTQFQAKSGPQAATAPEPASAGKKPGAKDQPKPPAMGGTNGKGQPAPAALPDDIIEE